MTDTSWRPCASPAGFLGLGVCAVLSLAALASGIFAIRQSVGFAMFLGLLVGVAFAALAVFVLIFTIGYFRLRYRFERQGLTVTWLNRRETIPYEQVDGIFAGQRLGQAMRVRGLNWPGFHVGVGRTRAMGFVRYFVTTGNLDQIVLVLTPAVTFAVSPADAAGFRRELIGRVEATDGAPPAAIAEEPEEPVPTASPIRDLSLAAMVLASLGVLAVTLMYIWARWSSIPDVIAMQFSRDGVPLVYGTRVDVFKLPGIGAAILIANLGIGLSIYARERAAARMLWATAVVVQVLVLVATARILH